MRVCVCVCVCVCACVCVSSWVNTNLVMAGKSDNKIVSLSPTERYDRQQYVPLLCEPVPLCIRPCEFLSSKEDLTNTGK